MSVLYPDCKKRAIKTLNVQILEPKTKIFFTEKIILRHCHFAFYG